MTESLYHTDVLRICTSTEIVKSNCVSIVGHKIVFDEVPDVPMETMRHDKELLNKLIDALCARLYNAFYIGRHSFVGDQSLATSNESQSRISSEFDLKDYITQLKIANGTREAWDHGWEIYHIGSDGRANVKRGDQSRIAWAGTYMLDTWMGVGAKIGDRVKLRVYSHIEVPLDSFFHSFGETLSDQFDDFKTLRFYFNVKRSSAVQLLGYIGQQFNHYRVPYHFKALADRAIYDRADATVLYVASRYYQIAASILSALPELLSDGLNEGVPMFTRAWARGIGVAQDPGSGESFGMHRCRLVAAALFEAWLQQKNADTQKFSFVEQSFSNAGIDLCKPYLNPGEADIFAQTVFSGGILR